MPTVLVTGATGKQGGATIEALLNDHDNASQKPTIKALTRNPSSPAATKLVKRGVTPVKGNLLDKTSLVSALQEVDAAFLVTDFMGGTDEEVKQGKTFIDAAVQAQLKHLVFTSVASADVAKSVPHFQSKWEIEEYLKKSSVSSWTILRPVAFNDNLAPSGIGRAMGIGFFSALAGPNTKVQWISCTDIGRIASKAILSPSEYKGQTIELAGDELSASELTKTFARAEGKPPGSRVWRAYLPGFLLHRIVPFDLSQMFKWFRSHGYSVDIKALRAKHPGLLTMESWARQEMQKAGGGKTDLIFDPALIPQRVRDLLPDDIQVRPLASDDYNRGHLRILAGLTKAPDVGLSSWKAQFNHLKSLPGTYYPIVLVQSSTDQICAIGTLFVEYKFLRGNAKAGHIEDIAVDEQIRGKGLGKLVIQALTAVSEDLGCYKTFLDCSEDNKAFYEKCGYKLAGVQMSKYAS